MRPSLTTIIRRLDKLFSKMHKSVKLYQAVEWKAAGGLLNAIYITLWKHPYIVNVPNLKSLIGTCQCLVVGEDSLTSLTDHHGPSGRRPELPPQNFCSVVFKLVALQVTFSKAKILLKERIITVWAAANEREFSSQDFSFFSRIFAPLCKNEKIVGNSTKVHCYSAYIAIYNEQPQKQ